MHSRVLQLADHGKEGMRRTGRDVLKDLLLGSKWLLWLGQVS